MFNNANGFNNEEEYDEDGRLISRVTPNTSSITSVDEEEYDEDGRLISKVTPNTSSITSVDEEEYDEDGRLISKVTLNTSSTTSVDEEEYDEDGRLISNTASKQDNNQIDLEAVEENTDMEILFANLKDNNKFLESKNEWVLNNDNENNNGLFFIRNTNEDILNMTIELTNSVGDLLWESEIRTLPTNTFVLDRKPSNNIYISKKILRAEDLLNGDNSYFFNIREIDTDKVFYIDVTDNRKISNDNLETFFYDEIELLSNNVMEESSIHEELIYTTDTEEVTNSLEESVDYINSQEDVEMEDIKTEESIENMTNEITSSFKLLKKRPTKENMTNEITPSFKLLKKRPTNDEITNEEVIESTFDNEVINEEFIQDVEEMKDDKDTMQENVKIIEVEKVVEKLVYPTDIKSIVINEVLNYAPVNIDYRINQTTTKLMNSLVIEKIGNYHIVVLNGFMNRPIYILNGEKRYFEFEGSIVEFIEKIKTIICTMYSMTSSEFESLTKLIILDEVEDTEMLDENATSKVISRQEIFDSIIQTNSNIIIDLLNDSCNLVFNDEENKTVKIISEGLGLHNQEETLRVVESLINKIGYDKVILTGLFINDDITIKNMNLDKECNIDTLSKYVFA